MNILRCPACIRPGLSWDARCRHHLCRYVGCTHSVPDKPDWYMGTLEEWIQFHWENMNKPVPEYTI